MARLPAGPIAPPAAGIQLQLGPHGYPSSRAGSRKVEGTISGAVAWPTGSPSMRACTLIDLATVKRGRRSWAGVFAYSPDRRLWRVQALPDRRVMTAPI